MERIDSFRCNSRGGRANSPTVARIVRAFSYSTQWRFAWFRYDRSIFLVSPQDLRESFRKVDLIR